MAAAVLLAGALSAAAPEEELRESDQEKIGEAIAEYFEARTAEEDIAEALAAVKEELDDVAKDVDVDPLALVEDLEKALYFANDYSKQRIRKGKGRIDDWTIEHGYFGDLELVIRAPRSYSGSKGPYPLILALPDAGQDPAQHLEEDWANSELLDQAIVVSFRMPEDTEAWSEIGDAGAPGGLGLVMASFGELKNTLAVDMDEVFLAGRGAAVPVALGIAAQYPHCFAGVIGRAGDAGDVPATNFANTATFFAGGGDAATAFQKATEEAGYGNSTVAPDAGVDEIWAWIQETRRDPMPARVVFAPTTRVGSTSFWLQVQGVEPGSSRVEAVADRASNTIRIDSEGVSTVLLYFNDLLVDLDRPVKVVANGTTHEDLIPRNFQTMLVNAYNNGDTGRVFTATYSYNVSEAVSGPGDGAR